MRPVKRGVIIVKANSDQKEVISYGSLKLYIPNRDKLQSNGRVSNLTLCTVVSSLEPEIKDGDIIVVGHNSLNNPATLIEKDQDTITVALPVDRWILGKLGNKGELIPLYGNTVCKRISETASSIIITPDAFKKVEPNKGIVLAIAPDVKGLHEGDTAIYHVHSDYEIHYSINGVDKSDVIVFQSDIVAVA